MSDSSVPQDDKIKSLIAEAYKTDQSTNSTNPVCTGPNSSENTEIEFAHLLDEIIFSSKDPTKNIASNNNTNNYPNTPYRSAMQCEQPNNTLHPVAPYRGGYDTPKVRRFWQGLRAQ